MLDASLPEDGFRNAVLSKKKLGGGQSPSKGVAVAETYITVKALYY